MPYPALLHNAHSYLKWSGSVQTFFRYRESPVLPFNAYGTMAIAREEFDSNSGSSQFFWLLKVRARQRTPLHVGRGLRCAS